MRVVITKNILLDENEMLIALCGSFLTLLF